MRIPRHARAHIVQMLRLADEFDKTVGKLIVDDSRAVDLGAEKLRITYALAAEAYNFARKCAKARDWRASRKADSPMDDQ